MVLSGEIFPGRWIRISTSLEVLSSIFLILILPLSLAFKNRINQSGSIGAKRYFLYNQGIFVQLRDLGPYPHTAASQAVIVVGDIGDSAGSEIGITI